MVSEILILTAATVFVFVTLLFVLSVILQRNDVADVAWGVGVVLARIPAYVLSGEGSFIASLVLGLACVWGARLSLRIFLRNRKKGEDFRYRVWRESWGRFFFVRSYIQIYLLQGFLMLVVGYPLIHVSLFAGDATVPGLVWLGALVWAVGFFFEVVGDYQLDRFMGTSHAPGTVLTSGLWRYTRHPNYFGEVTMWWGIGLMVLTIPHGVFALIGPLTITFLILKVSGIPLLEKKFADNPLFQKYACETSVFFPLPPRRCGE
jgi:steroid 5-alpha reductase family enzyme